MAHLRVEPVGGGLLQQALEGRTMRVRRTQRGGHGQRRQGEDPLDRGVAAAPLVAIEPGQETALGQELHGVARGIGDRHRRAVRFGDARQLPDHRRDTGGFGVRTGPGGGRARGEQEQGRKRQEDHGDHLLRDGPRAATTRMARPRGRYRVRRRPSTAPVPKAVAARPVPPAPATGVTWGPAFPLPVLGTWWTGCLPPDPAPG